MYKLPVFILCCFCFSAHAQERVSFRSFNDALNYADAHSVVFKNATQENILAKYQTLMAKLGAWNLKSDAAFSATDNTKLGITFIPAEVFGGAAGTFQKVTFGQPYVSNVNVAPQVDLLNMGAAARVKTAKANEQLIRFNHLVSRKGLYDNLATAFFNSISCMRQLKVTENSLLNADTLVAIMVHKQQAGIARTQDVNNAMANSLATSDKLQQLQFQLKEQYNMIKLLCDMDSGTLLEIADQDTPEPLTDNYPVPGGDLLQSQQEWALRYQEADRNAVLKSFLPTVTLFSSFSLQQNTAGHFFDKSQWFASNYVGLRLTLALIPDISKLNALKSARVNLAIAATDLQHARLQDINNNTQLLLEYQKALNSYRLAIKIEQLKKDSYQKDLNIYKEGILSATDLLTSLNEWYAAALNSAAQFTACAYAKAGITITNTVK